MFSLGHLSKWLKWFCGRIFSLTGRDVLHVQSIFWDSLDYTEHVIKLHLSRVAAEYSTPHLIRFSCRCCVGSINNTCWSWRRWCTAQEMLSSACSRRSPASALVLALTDTTSRVWKIHNHSEQIKISISQKCSSFELSIQKESWNKMHRRLHKQYESAQHFSTLIIRCSFSTKSAY